MDTINTVLTAYAISPLKIEQITNRVWRIDDGHSSYALKKSTLNAQTVSTWENVLHEAKSRHIAHILPVYLTADHSLHTKEKEKEEIYYLTPWVEAEKQSIDSLYHCLGSIHSKTKQSCPVNKKGNKEVFHAYKEKCRKTDERLLQYVENYEKNRYMSPFELQVCTQYRDLELAGKERRKRIDQFLDVQRDQNRWNYSLCHGNVQSSHILYGNQTYITNWESSLYTNAVHDLIHFFNAETYMHNSRVKEMIDQFHVYMEANELTKSELYLLTIHLLDPAAYMACVEKYPASPGTNISQIQKLMHAHRRIIFGLHWSNYVEETYEKLVLDDLESD